VDVSDGAPRSRGDELDDEESPDAATPASGARSRLDVTPRTSTRTATASSAGVRRYLAVGGVVLLVGALGVVLFNGLNDAALFYFNVDEALEQRDELGEDRFRMQGNVIDGTIEETPEGVAFQIAYGEAELGVQHRGDPPELFSAEIPVIIEGRFGEAGFESDEILIRHDNVYTEDHDDRLRDANDDAEDRARSAG
jgi:cytochrome c-type biogenesis protein CcmE